LFIADYNFCWRPEKMRITRAMAARVTDRFWTFADLMAERKAVQVRRSGKWTPQERHGAITRSSYPFCS
jgi:hypothetical protein